MYRFYCSLEFVGVIIALVGFCLMACESNPAAPFWQLLLIYGGGFILFCSGIRIVIGQNSGKAIKINAE